MRRMWSLLVASALAIGYVLLADVPANAGFRTATVEFGSFPSVSRADNGDTVELAGEGSFTLQPKSINGVAPRIADAFGDVPRTFIHRDAQGDVLAQGTWEPNAVLSYQSFGPATEEQNAEFGGLPPGTEGGKLRMKVTLLVGGEDVADGVITIVCLLGEPPANAEEGMLLLVQDTGVNFNRALSGDNVFIRHVD